MSPAIVSLVLWIPFLLTVIISGILFCRSGYRKGVWRALIAFGATLIAAGLSILFANLLSGLISPAITSAIPVGSLGEDQLTARLTVLFIGTAIRSALSLVLFWLLTLILTIVLRSISARIQRDKLITPQKSLRWVGLGVGAVCAVVFALLWLCPLYSSLATFVPIADNALATREEPGTQSQARTYLQSIRNHPVVVVSGSAPMELVYNGATSTAVGDASIPITDIAGIFEEATELTSQIVQTDENDAIAEKSIELVALLRNEVINQKWFHTLSMVLVEEAGAGAAQMTGPEAIFTQKFVAVFDLPQDVYSKNCDKLLAFFDYALRNDIIDILQTEDWDRLYTSGIVKKAGALANCTKEAVELKQLLAVSIIADSFFARDYEAAMDLLEEYPVGKITDPAMQLREAEAILQYMLMSSTPAEFALRYPSFGEAALDALMADADLVAFANLPEETQEELRTLLSKEPKYAEALRAQALRCSQEPIGTTNFRNSCNLLLGVYNFSKSGVFSYHDEYDADSFRFALDTIGINAFGLLPAGKKAFVVMESIPQALEADPTLENEYSLSSGINGTHWLIFAAEEHTILSDPRGQNTTELDICIRMYLQSPLTIATVKHYVDTHDTDPLRLGSWLSEAEIAALHDLIDGYFRDNQLDADALSSGTLNTPYVADDGSFVGSVVSFGTNMTAEDIDAYNSNMEEALSYLKLLLGI